MRIGFVELLHGITAWRPLLLIGAACIGACALPADAHQNVAADAGSTSSSSLAPANGEACGRAGDPCTGSSPGRCRGTCCGDLVCSLTGHVCIDSLVGHRENCVDDCQCETGYTCDGVCHRE